MVDRAEGVIELYGVLFFEISKKMILKNKLSKIQLDILKKYLKKRLINII